MGTDFSKKTDATGPAFPSDEGGGRPPVPASGLAALQVLVVEDDPFLQELTHEVLHSIGVPEVYGAEDGTEALVIMEAAPRLPDVIICDVEMQGMDGIVFMRHLASRGFNGGIIVLSGTSSRIMNTVADLVRRHDMHLLGMLKKPLQPTELTRLLEIAIPTNKAPRSEKVLPGSQLLTRADLRKGIDEGYVQIALQPKLALATGQLVGAEALLRWNDPLRGTVMPAVVIPVAEDTGLIDELTLTIFRRAAECEVVCRAKNTPLSISVNLSVSNLSALDLPEKLVQIIDETTADPRRMILEVTESRLMENLSSSLEVLGRLSLAGFRLSMDDFGTGFATLEKLKQLPFDELKIDRAFVSGVADDPMTQAILRSSIELGRALGLTVVAEGVETQSDWDALAAMGCNEAQGYYLARPMPAAVFTEWAQVFGAMTDAG